MSCAKVDPDTYLRAAELIHTQEPRDARACLAIDKVMNAYKGYERALYKSYILGGDEISSRLYPNAEYPESSDELGVLDGMCSEEAKQARIIALLFMREAVLSGDAA